MARERYFGNTYDIRNTRGQLVTTINEKELDRTSTSLVLHGRGYSPYGLARNENIVHRLENFSNTTPPNNPIDGQLWWKRAEVGVEGELFVLDTAIGSPSWRTVVPPNAGIGFSITPGDGFDQATGGLPTGSPLTVTIDLSAGRGIQLGANAVGTQTGQIEHDNLLNFVANEHYDHAAIVIVGGDGIVGGSPGFPITGSISLNVGAGKGIIVNTNDVAIDNAAVLRTTSNQTVVGIKEFTNEIFGDIGSVSASVPSYAFSNDSNTGWYRSSTNQISFTTGATQRLRIESGGVLRAISSTYELLVLDDNDIPNKKYVDGALAASENPTDNTHIGYQSISGLLTDTKYLVHVYGRIRTAGTGTATLSAITLRRGSTTPGAGTFVASTPFQSINWPDGSCPTSATFICDMNASTTVNGVTEQFGLTGSGATLGVTYMSAVQISEPPPVGSPIPSSGAPELDDVDGASSSLGATFAFSPWDALAVLTFGVQASSHPYILQPDDVSTAAGNETAFVVYTALGNDWLPGGGTASDFEVRADTVSLTGSGLTASGATGTWLSLGSIATWILVKNANNIGLGTWVLDYQVRQKTNHANSAGPARFTLRTKVII